MIGQKNRPRGPLYTLRGKGYLSAKDGIWMAEVEDGQGGFREIFRGSRHGAKHAVSDYHAHPERYQYRAQA